MYAYETGKKQLEKCFQCQLNVVTMCVCLTICFFPSFGLPIMERGIKKKIIEREERGGEFQT
jgi:hypothetical protein